jgi:hypothetical protein
MGYCSYDNHPLILKGFSHIQKYHSYQESKLMKKIKQELQNRINDTIAKNTNKGLWHSLTKLKVSDCKLGDIVLYTMKYERIRFYFVIASTKRISNIYIVVFFPAVANLPSVKFYVALLVQVFELYYLDLDYWGVFRYFISGLGS